MDLLAAYMWIAYPCLPAGLHSHKVLQWVMKGCKHALLLPTSRCFCHADVAQHQVAVTLPSTPEVRAGRMCCTSQMCRW